MATTTVTNRVDQRHRLLEVARARLESSGPRSLRARSLTAEVGASTQAIYTQFGGMPGLLEALVREGFGRLARHVEATPQTDDPVADFFARGAAYCDWALTNPQLYRLMFGLTDDLHLRSALGVTGEGEGVGAAEGQAAFEVMIRSLTRVVAEGRIREVDPRLAAGQFLSATHGYLALALGGAFGPDARGSEVIAALGSNLMVGLGDDREAAQRSLLAAAAGRDESW